MGATSLSGRVTRILASRRRQEEEAPSVGGGGDVVEFEFLDDGSESMSLAKSSSSDECCSNEMELLDDVDNDEERENNDASVKENRSYWDNQHQLLQSVICRSSSIETGIRNATKEAINEIQSAETVCGCGREMTLSCCRMCLMREVSRRLQNHGYNTAICKTKWRSSLDIPAGEHNFVDVIDNRNPKKGEMRVIIELNLRAEFEMARGSEEYNRLVRRLPEVFVGKAERLSNIIKIMCNAGKKCMKQKKMHMGPWRKHKYMQAKWLGPCERNTNWNSTSLFSKRILTIMPKPRQMSSMLTVDLLDKLPNMHCKVAC